MSDQKNNSLQKAKNKRVVYLFFATFFFSMFLVGFIIKALSPNVDVEIGDDVETTQEQSTDDSATGGNVDNRLKWIQFEDNMPGVSKRLDATEPNSAEKTLSDKQKLEDKKQDELDLDEKSTQDMKTSTYKVKKLEPPVPTSSEVARSSNVPRISKVYVGYYTSIDQAISVQNKIIDSDLNASPFVKEVNGYYVVQVGSFANKQKAQLLYSEVSAMGLPAKMVSE